jgi:hypothetical protein
MSCESATGRHYESNVQGDLTTLIGPVALLATSHD